ncbi:anti-sigma factor [Staphylococcus succinus]|uniref:anti-sigma factor n=1 Tax=Staphylococcus succinus TaxID=61015 RepID=UPI002DB6A481|nr:anti-sigma factor [Staphylococcus succinus]MEB7463085.1 anti-sigma factor [Staphylococcus succinus]
MKDNKVDEIYDYFNDKLSESEKERVEEELNLSSESHKTLKDIEILHDTLPYKNKQVEPPIGMKQRILESVLNEEKTSDKDIKNENQEEGFNSTNSETNNQFQQHINVSTQDNKKHKSAVIKRFSVGIIAAMLLLSLIGNGVQFWGNKESKNQSTSMINTGDAKAINLKSMSNDKTQGQAYLSNTNNKTDRKLIVEAKDIETTKGNQVYQVWVLKDNKPYPAGAFSSENNKGMVVFDLSNIDIDKNDKIALTLEPSPNNTEPKGQMVMASSEI